MQKELSKSETTQSREVACFNLALIYKYAKEHDVADRRIFEGIESFRDICLNPYEWTSAEVWSHMAANIETALSDEPNPLYSLGSRVLKEHISGFQFFFFKIAPLPVIIQQISAHIAKNIHKNLMTEVRMEGKGRGVLRFTPLRKGAYSEQICRFNQGFAYAVLELKGYRNIRIEELQCAAKGASSCEYLFMWDEIPSVFGKIRNLFFSRVRDHYAIIRHMEENHYKLQQQYKEILSIRDFYSHIMQNMQESVVWLNEKLIIEFSNTSFAGLIGAGRVAEGKMFREFTSNESDRELFSKAVKNCRMQRAPKTVELSFRRCDGEERIGQTTIVWVESAHRESGFIISIRDITESKLMERKLMLAEDRYRSLYENSPALIIGINVEGYIIYANPAMVAQSGYSEEELKEMHFSTLISPQADLDTDQLFEEVLKCPTRLQEVDFRTKSGEWKTIAFNSYQIFEENGIGLAGIGIDITETKKLNEQLIKTHRMELLGQMAGGLAHDFNNIMTAICGYAHIIATRANEEKVRNQADIILSATSRASDLVKKLLSFSREDKVEMNEIDLGELMQETFALIRGSTSFSVNMNIEMPRESLVIFGDSTKIHQCILNLGINARDAIGKKSDGLITLRLRTSPQNSNRVWIQVEDNGIGIPPDQIERVFDPFFSTKKKKEGTGLGLSVVYGIIKAHKGEIFVESKPGEGTTFTIELPFSTSVPG